MYGMNWNVHISWSNSEKQKKNSSAWHVYFWRFINGFEVLNIPAISYSMRQNHLAEVSAELRTLRFEQETESTRQKLLRSFGWLSAVLPCVVGGGWDARQFCEIIWKWVLSWNKWTSFSPTFKASKTSLSFRKDRALYHNLDLLLGKVVRIYSGA